VYLSSHLSLYLFRPVSPPAEFPVRPLEPGEGSRPLGSRSGDGMGPVDLGADPRRLGNLRRPLGEGTRAARAKSPLQARQKVYQVPYLII